MAFPVENDDFGFPFEEPVHNPFTEEPLQGPKVSDIRREDGGPHILVAGIQYLENDVPLGTGAELHPDLVDNQEVYSLQS